MKVTGYRRSDIIPRNCRFLQGPQTDRIIVKGLKSAIDHRQESVELLLNYRKNGDPFWNLLYVAPLYNQSGKVAFFLGAQINCSTTINSRSEVLRLLSTSDDTTEDKFDSVNETRPAKKGLLSSFKKPKQYIPDRAAGIEDDLVDRIEGMELKNQMDEFYSAYSKVRPSHFHPFSDPRG